MDNVQFKYVGVKKGLSLIGKDVILFRIEGGSYLNGKLVGISPKDLVELLDLHKDNVSLAINSNDTIVKSVYSKLNVLN